MNQTANSMELKAERRETGEAEAKEEEDDDGQPSSSANDGGGTSDQEIVVGIDEDHIKFLTSMHDEEPSNGHHNPAMERRFGDPVAVNGGGAGTAGKLAHRKQQQHHQQLQQQQQQHHSLRLNGIFNGRNGKTPSIAFGNGSRASHLAFSEESDDDDGDASDDDDDDDKDDSFDDDDDGDEDVMAAAESILSKTAQRSSDYTRRYRCDLCPRAFHRPDFLQYHMRTHEKSNSFECKLCFSIFASDPAFAHHIRTEHAGMGLADALPPVPESEAHFAVCTYCDKTFADGDQLEDHLHQQHLGVRPFKCNMCPKAFIRMDFLQCHYAKYHNFHRFGAIGGGGNGGMGGGGGGLYSATFDPIESVVQRAAMTMGGHAAGGFGGGHGGVHGGDQGGSIQAAIQAAIQPRLSVRKMEDLLGGHGDMAEGRRLMIAMPSANYSRRTSHTGTTLGSSSSEEHEDDDDDELMVLGDDVPMGAVGNDHRKRKAGTTLTNGGKARPAKKKATVGLAAKAGVPVAVLPQEEVGQFRCPVCERRFVREPELMAHVRIHPDLPTYKCPLCELTFIGSDYLKGHLKKHVVGDGEDPDAPGAIDMKTFNESTATTDISSPPSSALTVNRPSSTVSTSGGKLPSKYPSKPPSTGISLLKPIEERKPPDNQQQHQQPHEYCIKTADGKFMCTVCERLFSHQQTVRIHFRIHTNEKPYKCTFCGESYIRSDYLERHLKVHFKDGALPAAAIASMAAAAARDVAAAVANGRTAPQQTAPTPPPALVAPKEEFIPESTTITGKKTPTPSAAPTTSTPKPLIGRAGLAPENYHFAESNDGQFVCKICDKVFAHVASLRKHALAHTEEKPFHCEICDRSFNRVDYLKEHFKSKRHLQLVAEAAGGTVERNVEEEEDDSTMDDSGPPPAIAVKRHSNKSGTNRGKQKIDNKLNTPNTDDACVAEVLPLAASSCGNSRSSNSSSSSSSSSSNSSSNSNSSSSSSGSGDATVRQSPGTKSIANTSSAGAGDGDDAGRESNGGSVGSTPSEFHRSDYERTSDGRYKCNQCDKTFVTAVTLKMHIRLHTGEKPYKCDKCDKAFIRSDYLKTHEKTHRQQSFLSLLALTSKEPSTASEAGEDSDGEEDGHTNDRNEVSRSSTVMSNGPHEAMRNMSSILKDSIVGKGVPSVEDDEEAEENESGEEEDESEDSEEEEQEVIKVTVKDASCSESEEDDDDDDNNDDENDNLDEEEGEDEEEELDGDDHGEDRRQNNGVDDDSRSANRGSGLSLLQSKKEGTKLEQQSDHGFHSNHSHLSGGESSNNGYDDHEDDSISQASGGTTGGGSSYGQYHHPDDLLANGGGVLGDGDQKGKHRCPMCDKLFAWPKSLKIHLRTHTGEKPYRCDLCGKCFGRSDSLRGHKRTHADERLVQCHLCDVSCPSATELVQHQLLVHNIQPLEC